MSKVGPLGEAAQDGRLLSGDPGVAQGAGVGLVELHRWLLLSLGDPSIAHMTSMNLSVRPVCRHQDILGVTEATRGGGPFRSSRVSWSSRLPPCDDLDVPNQGNVSVSAPLLAAWTGIAAVLVAASAISHNEIALVLVVILVSMFVHEFGHALVAHLRGFSVAFACIGNGPRVLRLHLEATPVELRFRPCSPVWLAAFTPTPHRLRTRVASYASAGVVTCLALAAITWPFAGENSPYSPSPRCTSCNCSIWRRSAFVGGATPRASDGFLLLKALTGPVADLQERYVAPLLRRNYLQELQRDPPAALTTAQVYRDPRKRRGDDADVMTVCAEAATGQWPSTLRLETLWDTASSPQTSTLCSPGARTA